jgi:hypothetical protein
MYGKAHTGVVHHNISYRNSTEGPWGSNIYMDSPNYITCEYNIAWGGVRGIGMQTEPANDESYGNIIRYNIIYGVSSNGITLGGYQGGDVHHCQIYNNVLYQCGRNISFENNPGHDNVIVNNIFYGSLVDHGMNDTVDYNCYFNGTGPGSHSLQNTNPRFANAANHDFSLQSGSPCIDKGTNQYQADFDFNGSPVPVDGDGSGDAVVDMGPFEHQSTGIGGAAAGSAVLKNELKVHYLGGRLFIRYSPAKPCFFSFSLYNVSGRKVIYEPRMISTFVNQVPTRGLGPGMYIARMAEPGGGKDLNVKVMIR